MQLALLNHLRKDMDELNSLIFRASTVDGDEYVEALEDVAKQAKILLLQIEAGPVTPPAVLVPDPWQEELRHEEPHKYVVTERQVLTYTWEVEAHSLMEARDTAIEGVPDNATEKLIESDVTAELVP